MICAAQGWPFPWQPARPHKPGPRAGLSLPQRSNRLSISLGKNSGSPPLCLDPGSYATTPKSYGPSSAQTLLPNKECLKFLVNSAMLSNSLAVAHFLSCLVRAIYLHKLWRAPAQLLPMTEPPRCLNHYPCLELTFCGHQDIQAWEPTLS